MRAAGHSIGLVCHHRSRVSSPDLIPAAASSSSADKMVLQVTGLHLSVCSLELSVYYGHQQCPGCAGGTCVSFQGIPLYWSSQPANLTVPGAVFWDQQGFRDPILLFSERVRATSVILLLGVGSFVCYKLYQQLKQRLRKNQDSSSSLKHHPRLLDWLSDELLTADVPENPQCIEGRYFGPDNISDDGASDISDSPCLDSSDASLGDQEFSSESEDCGGMGNSASSPYDGVVYHKGYGIHFKKCQSAAAATTTKDVCNNPRCQQFHVASSSPNLAKSSSAPTAINPVVHRSSKNAGSARLRFDLTPGRQHLKQDFENSGNSTALLEESLTASQDAVSLVGNFSPGSLKERSRLLSREFRFPSNVSDIRYDEGQSNSEFINDDFSEESPAFVFDPFIPPPLSRELSLDSCSGSLADVYLQKYGRTSSMGQAMVRGTSFDSEISEFSSLELCKPAIEETEFSTVEKLDELQNEIQDIKQSVLDLDADFDGLKVYTTKPPVYGWTIADVSDMGPNSFSDNSSNDLVELGKAREQSQDLIHEEPAALDSTESSNGGKAIAMRVSDAEYEEGGKNSDSLHTNAGSNASLPWDSPRHQKKAVDQDAKLALNCLSSTSSSGGTGNLLSPYHQAKVPHGLGYPKMPTIADSGSDFGNSLDSDSVDLSAQHCSLEWDHGSMAGECDGCANSAESKQQGIIDAGADYASYIESLVASRCNVPTTATTSHVHGGSLANQIQNEPISMTVQSESGTSSLATGGAANDALSSEVVMKESGYHGGELSASTSSSQQMDTKPEPASSSDAAMDNRPDAGQDQLVVSSGKCDQNGNSLRHVNAGDDVDNVTANAVQTSLLKDSAYCDSSTLDDRLIGERISLMDYLHEELQGDENDAVIPKVYQKLSEETGSCQMVRRIHGSNYYGVIQASVFQILTSGLPVLQNYGGATAVYHKLESWMQGCCPWLQDWTFANQLPYMGNNCLQGFWECLSALEKLEDQFGYDWDKERQLIDVLNSDPQLVVHISEAVKLLMLVASRDLYQQLQTDDPTPTFAMLLFARDSSRDPREFMLNYLNHVGETKHLEQVEMFLLGYALYVTLKVISPRAACDGCADFVSHFPEANIGRWPEVVLIESDQHQYNVPVR